MSVDNTNLVRDALELQAQRAVDPERIRAALPGRIVRYRRRRAVATVVAVAAAAAVAVSVPAFALRSWSHEPASPAGQPTTGTASPAGQPTAKALPAASLRYMATWVPEGYVQHFREVPLGTEQSVLEGPEIFWSKASIGGAVSVTEMSEKNVPAIALCLLDGAKAKIGAAGGPRVDVNGRPGEFVVPPNGVGKLSLLWSIDDTTTADLVVVNAPEVSQQNLLKMARSVQATTTQVVMPQRLGWLPNNLPLQDATVGGESATSWVASVSLGMKTGTVGGPDRHAVIEVGTAANAPSGGESLSIAGRSGRYLDVATGRGQMMVVVDLGGGRTLTVQSNGLTRDETVKIAENVQVEAAFEVSWIGR